MFVRLIQHFGLETEVSEHLSNSYGDRSWAVASLASLSGHRWPVFGRRLVPYYPYIEAEVRYACQREYACTAIDVLARRTRLSFLNAYAALEALPRVIEIMSEELEWDEPRRKMEFEETLSFLKTMGLVMEGVGNRVSPNADMVTFFTRSHFLPHELAKYRSEFSKLDHNDSGYILEKDLDKVLLEFGVNTTRKELDKVFSQIKLNRKHIVEFSEFLEVKCTKDGQEGLGGYRLFKPYTFRKYRFLAF